MKRGQLTVVRREGELPVVPAPEAASEAAPLLHLRITGRHGVFLLQEGTTGAQQAVVDTRAPDGIRCTCAAVPPAAGECAHVALLRACGFLDHAA